MTTTTTITDGGPAYPHTEHNGDGSHYHDHLGMSLRVYAAVQLRVPASGIDWLDEMIAQADGAAAPGGEHPDFETVRYRANLYERRPGGPSNGRYVPEGHGIPAGWWLYEVTSADEVGLYDQLYRRKPERAKATAPAQPDEVKALQDEAVRLRGEIEDLRTALAIIRDAEGAPKRMGDEMKRSIEECRLDSVSAAAFGWSDAIEQYGAWSSDIASAALSPAPAKAEG